MYEPVIVIYTFFFFKKYVGNFAKINNSGAFWLKEVRIRSCSTNNDNGKMSQETINENDESFDNYDQEIKSKILRSSLPYVPEHGWSRDTVAAGTYR